MRPREKNEHLLRRIQDGDETARQEMIVTNMRLVYKLAKVALTEYQGPDPEQMKEEMVSAGYVGLCKAIKRIHNLRHNNVSGYLRKWILGQMYREPKRFWERKPKGRCWVQLPLVESNLHSGNEQAVVDALDEIEHACTSDMDREIIAIRREKATLVDAAKAVDRHVSNVQGRLRAIEQRFDEGRKNHPRRGEEAARFRQCVGEESDDPHLPEETLMDKRMSDYIAANLNERPDGRVAAKELIQGFRASLASDRERKLWPRWKCLDEISKRYATAKGHGGRLFVLRLSNEPSKKWAAVEGKAKLVRA